MRRSRSVAIVEIGTVYGLWEVTIRLGKEGMVHMAANTSEPLTPRIEKQGDIRLDRLNKEMREIRLMWRQHDPVRVCPTNFRELDSVENSWEPEIQSGTYCHMKMGSSQSGLKVPSK